MVLAEIIALFCTVEEAFFITMDSVQIDSYTWLDVMVALMLFSVIINFINDLRSYKE